MSGEPGSAPLVLLSERLGPVTERELSLRAIGAEVRGAPLWSLQEIREHGAGAQVIILGAVEPFNAVALDALPDLAAIVRRGVGTDNVDLAAATRLGVVVANVPDASVEEVSDHALALLLAIERGIVPLDAGVREGAWRHDPRAIQELRRPIRRLRSLTLGVVGLGRIGRALVRKAGPIYGRVLACDPVTSMVEASALEVKLVSQADLFARSDHISLHAPLSPATSNLIDSDALDRMRAGAVLVNTSRGGLVDELAVLAAVSDGRLRGAGLDVTATEPLPADSPLVLEPRVLLTAHSAASSDHSDAELAERSVEATLAILSSRRPASVANPDVLRSDALRAHGLRGPDAPISPRVADPPSDQGGA